MLLMLRSFNKYLVEYLLRFNSGFKFDQLFLSAKSAISQEDVDIDIYIETRIHIK